MNKSILLFGRFLLYFLIISAVTSLQSFKKNTPVANGTYASSYNTDVLNKWMEMQIKLMSTTIANFNGPFVRVYAYTALAAYESILPGIPKNSSHLFSTTFLNKLPALPAIESDKKYHWPSSVNAALAYMNRAMFPITSPSNRVAMDSLEIQLKKQFSKDADAATIERSSNYGKLVAQIIFEWAETDGYRHASDPYVPPGGKGKWVPTPPNFVKASTPYWGGLRTMVIGSIENTQPSPPPSYSEDTASMFYKMIKEVYDVDQSMTSQQKDIVLFWRDINPGMTAPGHWMNILRQVLEKEKKKIGLDKAAFAYALSGMALNDSWISCWKTRYEYNLLRPVTFIRNVMGHSDWLPLLSTPPHPEYTSGFAAMAGAVCESLAIVFGNNYKITDHSYDYLGMNPRSYSSFYSMAEEAGNSKFYGGIHYKLSVDVGLKQGKAVAKNIEEILFNGTTSAKLSAKTP